MPWVLARNLYTLALAPTRPFPLGPTFRPRPDVFALSTYGTVLTRAAALCLSVPLRLTTREPQSSSPSLVSHILVIFFTSRLWLSIPGLRSSSALLFPRSLRSSASSVAGSPPSQPSDFGPSSTPFGLHRPPPAAPLLTRLIPTASSVTRPRNAHIPAFPARPRALPSPCLQGREERP